METKDELAQKLFHAPYNRISAFAQDRVDGLWNALNERQPAGLSQQNKEIQGKTLEQRIDFLNERVARIEMEYEEIWIENTQLKEDLATLQAEINQRSS